MEWMYVVVSFLGMVCMASFRVALPSVSANIINLPGM